ncbi:MAG: septum formation initiator family protein [Deltaproteobacteria bacterium]|nr:MAG: septum formation initiator family protein [Deltaproteobacteria bacterium]
MGPGRAKIRLILVGLALVLAAASAFSEGGLPRVQRLEAEVARIEALNASLEQENAGLLLEIQALRSDDAAIERVAREELGLVRPGEIVFRFVPAAGDAP